jgi:hypothetical protein
MSHMPLTLSTSTLNRVESFALFDFRPQQLAHDLLSEFPYIRSLRLVGLDQFGKVISFNFHRL